MVRHKRFTQVRVALIPPSTRPNGDLGQPGVARRPTREWKEGTGGTTTSVERAVSTVSVWSTGPTWW